MPLWIIIVWGLTILGMLFGGKLFRRGREDGDPRAKVFGGIVRVLSALTFLGLLFSGWIHDA